MKQSRSLNHTLQETVNHFFLKVELQKWSEKKEIFVVKENNLWYHSINLLNFTSNESLNKVVSQREMDFVVRYFDDIIH